MSKSQPVVHSRSAGPAIGPWSDIDPSLVEDGGGIGPAFPLDLLPLPWRAWIADTARATGAPADYVVQSVLAAVAGLCGAGVVVRVTPSWSEPLVLRLALVGRRSTGKSPALAAMHSLLAGLEAELKQSDAERTPRIVVTDARATALSDALSARPQGVLLWRDDASSWFSGLAEPAGADDSDAIPIVSVLGSMRPDHLMEALADGEDGFAASFLYAWPDPPPYCRLVERRSPDNEQAFALLRRISGAAGTQKPLALVFDEAAANAFDGFLADLHVELRTAEGLEADWMGKGSGTVARLAGVLELLAWSGSEAAGTPHRIGANAVEAAARLWSDYFRPQANLVFDRAGPTDLQRQARRVVRWLQASGLAQVTREDVRCRALCRSVKASRTDLVLGRLWAGGVVRPVAHISPPQGGRPPQLWDVNPALALQK
jgi:hypothetical protein